MASQELVKLEFTRRQPYYRYKACGAEESQRLMEDHIIGYHLSGPAPYNCGRCNKKFARRDTARGHVTKRHSGKTFATTIMLNPDVGASFLSEYATLLDKQEGMMVAQKKVEAREHRNQARKALEPREETLTCASETQDQPPKKEEMPEVSEKARDTSHEQKEATEDAIPRTPVLALHPPNDELLFTPVSVISPLPTRAVSTPAGPTLRDIADLLSQLKVQQDELLTRVGKIEEKQDAAQLQLDELQKELTRNSQTCSSAQGENRRLGNSVGELKADVAVLVKNNGKVVEAAKALTTATGSLDSIEASVDSLCMGQGVEALRIKESITGICKQVEKVALSTNSIPEMARSLAASRDSLKSVEKHIRTTSSNQTVAGNRTRAAFREIMHGVQRSMDAFDNRQGAHAAPRNDEDRSDREERARRPLYL